MTINLTMEEVNSIFILGAIFGSEYASGWYESEIEGIEEEHVKELDTLASILIGSRYER